MHRPRAGVDRGEDHRAPRPSRRHPHPGRSRRPRIRVIIDGTATVHVGDRTIAVLGPGDFFGEIALLDNGPRTATVIADTDLIAEVSSHPEFVDLLTDAPTLARNLLVGLARRLRAADLQLTA